MELKKVDLLGGVRTKQMTNRDLMISNAILPPGWTCQNANFRAVNFLSAMATSPIV